MRKRYGKPSSVPSGLSKPRDRRAPHVVVLLLLHLLLAGTERERIQRLVARLQITRFKGDPGTLTRPFDSTSDGRGPSEQTTCATSVVNLDIGDGSVVKRRSSMETSQNEQISDKYCFNYSGMQGWNESIFQKKIFEYEEQRILCSEGSVKGRLKII